MSERKGNLTILQATDDHIDQLVPLFDQYRQFYRQTPELTQAKEFLTERLTRHESVIFLASLDQRAAGFTQLYPSFSSVSMRRLWILNDLFVAPASRQQGVATALLERARQFAVETDAKGLVLETAIDNPARQLYERLGWRRDDAYVHYSLLIEP